LNPPIDASDIYMTLPPDIERINPDIEGSLFHLLEALSGLRQAPRLWWKEIDAFFLSHGMRKSKSKPGLYIGNELIILLYVDDMLLLYRDKDIAREMKKMLAAEYQIRGLGPVKRFLGLECRLAGVSESNRLTAVCLTWYPTGCYACCHYS
jgi:hypothetical protein